MPTERDPMMSRETPESVWIDTNDTKRYSVGCLVVHRHDLCRGCSCECHEKQPPPETPTLAPSGQGLASERHEVTGSARDAGGGGQHPCPVGGETPTLAGVLTGIRMEVIRIAANTSVNSAMSPFVAAEVWMETWRQGILALVQPVVAGLERRVEELEAQTDILKSERVGELFSKQATDHPRLFDMVRYCRGKLLDEGLITAVEYTDLVSGRDGSQAARRLETYDALTAERDALREAVQKAIDYCSHRKDGIVGADAVVALLTSLPSVCPACHIPAPRHREGCGLKGKEE